MEIYDQVGDFLVRLRMFRRMASEDLCDMLDTEEDRVLGYKVRSWSDRDLYDEIFINLINEIVERECDELVAYTKIPAEAAEAYNKVQAQLKEQMKDLKKQKLSELVGNRQYSFAWIQRLFSAKCSWIALAFALKLTLVFFFLRREPNA